MHPDADKQQDCRREERGEAFQELAVGTADPDHPGRRSPGGDAGDERHDPAGMDVFQHVTALGAAEEADHGDHDQQRLQPFAEQDREGPKEGGDGARLVRCERVLGLHEQRVETRDQRLKLGGRHAAADPAAQLGHRLLHRDHDLSVARGEQALDRLEAFKIGVERQLLRTAAVAGAIGFEAALEQLASDVQAAGSGRSRDGGRIGAQIGDHGRGTLLTDVPSERRRRKPGKGREVRNPGAQRGVALPHLPSRLRERSGICKAAGMECECPAVRLRQVGEALHRRALEPLVDHLIEGKGAPLASAAAIGEIDRRRLESPRERSVAGAARSMAGGAVLGI